MGTKKAIYRVIFHNQGKVYELYARHVGQADLCGFVEVGDFIFGERTAVLVDPAEERLKAEYAGVKRTYVPLHAVLRIDQVEKEGVNKITSSDDKGSNVTPFPTPLYTPTPEGSGSS